MLTAFFDCPFGAAGDMLLGALIDAGLDFDLWKEELTKIALPDGCFSVRLEKLLRCGIHSTKLHVFLSADDAHEHDHRAGLAHHHDAHTHPHKHGHEEHSHDSSHNHSHGPSEHPHRGLSEILRIIEKSSIKPAAKKLAAQIFTRLGEAEAKVHGVTPDQVHFHEVGAVDAIVDIVGFAIAYDLMNIERSIVSPLPVGAGTISSMHGQFPVPGPATLELLREARAPLSRTHIDYECLTPTGAAILTTIAEGFGSQPELCAIDFIGYGAGSLNPAGHPNVCRIVVGQSVSGKGGEKDRISSRYRSEFISVVECNFDDLSPQVIAYTSDKLLAEGALDVFVTPCTMKKGRPGHQLSVLCKMEDEMRVKEILLSETSTLGVRSGVTERLFAERETRRIDLKSDGSDAQSVRVKVGKDLDGNVINVQPEFEDCASVARSTGLPLKEVLSKAAIKARNGREEKR
ncbi:MAG TPA: nickel pincer cofactor biosynthesis protein LarC [Candidatus Melainabacteria bacterium]|nr:nickel pincer cofactor biosynthesis protein LarC [Candidatus Melainabacteria bacterium]